MYKKNSRIIHMHTLPVYILWTLTSILCMSYLWRCKDWLVKKLWRINVIQKIIVYRLNFFKITCSYMKN
ncbi:hypothetical protein Bpfe_025019 [Biomphalaria pfeifferi]|uniref:Uncharacterized protein n=1 Tax=Biomphalaria pfeifferi TaxID=112525 RepID=A0AAD8B1B9_BIOPF|nr:hypothetical protein Bpfe_025019 [Biomphalaria pfeifferi]